MGLFGRTSETDRAIAADTANAAQYADQAQQAQIADAEAARKAYEQRPVWQQLLAQMLKALLDAIPNHTQTTIKQISRRRPVSKSL